MIEQARLAGEQGLRGPEPPGPRHLCAVRDHAGPGCDPDLSGHPRKDTKRPKGRGRHDAGARAPGGHARSLQAGSRPVSGEPGLARRTRMALPRRVDVPVIGFDRDARRRSCDRRGRASDADYVALEQMGEKYYLSTTAGYLAAALLHQGRDDEADEFTAISERLAAPNDISSQSLWRTVRGRVLARHGLFEEGETLVRDALELIGRAEDPDSHAAVWADIAEVLIAAGRQDELGLRSKTQPRSWKRRGTSYPRPRRGSASPWSQTRRHPPTLESSFSTARLTVPDPDENSAGRDGSDRLADDVAAWLARRTAGNSALKVS